MELNGDDLRNLSPIICMKYRELAQLEEEIQLMNRAAFPRNSDAILVGKNGERTRVKIGDRTGVDIFVSNEAGMNFCVNGDRLILVDKIPGEQ